MIWNQQPLDRLDAVTVLPFPVVQPGPCEIFDREFSDRDAAILLWSRLSGREFIEQIGKPRLILSFSFLAAERPEVHPLSAGVRKGRKGPSVSVLS